ncbi:MAG: CapA family protein [Chloroflexota bacterium]|nr:CapA family protein [Chloroflexota bacterium]
MLPRRLPALLLTASFVLAACTSQPPAPSGSPGSAGSLPAAPASTEPTSTAAPTPQATLEFPLAVVTGFTNLKAQITVDEYQAALLANQVTVPCGLDEWAATKAGPPCLPADQIVDAVAAAPNILALLPAGLVEPKVKVLPVDGADLFGNAEARSKAYPLVFHVTTPDRPEDWAAWTAYDAGEVRTLMSVGESCPDRGVAYQAITLGKGWEYVFGGGTAAYQRIYPNPIGPGNAGDGFNIVDAVPTGNDGAVWKLIGGADITVQDFECPVVDNWKVNDGLVFGIDPRVLGFMKSGGTDVVTLAANHVTDQGANGLLETIRHFDEAGIKHAGAGANLDQALEPAVVDVHGVRFAVVGWNIVKGVLEAGPNQPGVAWINESNVRESVARARRVADVVICMPQWGYPEYRTQFIPAELDMQKLFLAAGCDQILGSGPHEAAEIGFTRDAKGLHFTVLGHGNFLFGQSWSQQTQEGMLPELTFRGTQLVQVRLHPYIMLDQAQASLTDPETDGHYVLQRVFEASDVSY